VPSLATPAGRAGPVGPLSEAVQQQACQPRVSDGAGSSPVRAGLASYLRATVVGRVSRRADRTRLAARTPRTRAHRI